MDALNSTNKNSTRHFVWFAIELAIVIAIVTGLIIGMARLWVSHRRVEVAQQYRPIVQAIADFRDTTGKMPESLQELVPNHLPAYPPETKEPLPEVRVLFSGEIVQFKVNDQFGTVISNSFIPGD
jgi:hypothetical protein